MPRFSTQSVSRILTEREGLQRIELAEGRKAFVLTELIGPVAVGDRVVVNTTAVDFGLGTGGWDVVHWNLSRESFLGSSAGAVMKLRYTSLQVDVGASEIELGDRSGGLDGVPVVVCQLHSQVPCVAATFKHRAPSRSLVFVMTDWGALPVVLSDVLAQSRSTGLIDAVVSAGEAFGGDYEAVTVTSALQVAGTLAGADALVVGPGPGVVGTGTALGFTGLESAAVLDAAARLGGVPIMCVRYSDADARERHRGVSHHTRTALDHAQGPVTVAVPAPMSAVTIDGRPTIRVVDVPDMGELLQAQSLAVTTMGRGLRDDPAFFRYAGAAGIAAAETLERGLP